MTATASKTGLRAKAEATRTKAAQRTPLPGKNHAENVRLAREAVAESKPAKKTPKTVPAPEATPDKGQRYAGELSALGWKSDVVRKDGMVELTATRGVEALYLSWFNEAHISGGSTYTFADRTVKVRNPAEALRLASRTADEAKSTQAKVSDNQQFKKMATGPNVRHIPFDVMAATEAEIVAALEGHQVTWHNVYRVESNTAIVGNAPWIRVSRHAKGHRIVSFVDPENGFRAFRLEHLENVGRKVNIERIKQEILNSLSRPERKSKAA